VGLPVPKTVIKAKPRPCFTACGEVSTHSQTYSAVPKRSLESWPRLQKAEKEAMIGESVEDLNAGLTAAATTGHALFWNEVKVVVGRQASTIGHLVVVVVGTWWWHLVVVVVVGRHLR